MRGILRALAVAVAAMAAGATFGADTAELPRIESMRTLSASETLLRLRMPPGTIVQGSVFLQPPGPPPVPTPEGEKQLGTPFEESGPPVATSDVSPTRVDDGEQVLPLAPGTFTLLRDSVLAPPGGMTSSVAEPNVGGQGNAIFTTHNWYAEISTNNGGSYTYVSPYSQFPATPAAFGAGFCCDQRVLHDANRNLVFWYLQYVKTASTAAGTNGVRIAVAHGQAGLTTNTWQSHDFTPANFGLSGKWFDFPHMQASANHLYFTTNIFNTVDDSFHGALIARIPLSQLDNNSSLTVDSYITTTFGSIGAVQGAAAEGTRPGRTTMYFGAMSGATSLRVLTWPEASGAPTVATVSGLANTTSATFTCNDPGGLNSCGRANTRLQTGWISDTELGFVWASAQNGGTRPFPYTRVAILNPSTLAILSQPDIYSTTTAMLYAAFAVNQRGHLGGVIDALGGNLNSTLRAIIRDDFSPNVVSSGWETFPVASGNSGTSQRWGDYNGIVPHERYPNTWVGVGHVQSGGSANSNSQVHNFWFARERDTTAAVSVSKTGGGTGTVSSNPAGINCGATCAGNFALGTNVGLSAVAAGNSTFTGWGGDCSGSGACSVAADAPHTVSANFALQTFSLTVTRNGPGSVTSAPAGITCGATCSASFNSGSTVSLTASPSAYATFSGWSGACSGSGACSVSMNAAKSVTANFVQDAYALSASISDGRSYTRIGDSLAYVMQVTNQGPAAAINLHLNAALAAGLASASWTCSAVAGFCPAQGSGSGALDLTTTLAAGCTLRCDFSATAVAVPGETIIQSISASPPSGPSASPVSATDQTRIVLFRDGFESGGDGAQ